MSGFSIQDVVDIVVVMTSFCLFVCLCKAFNQSPMLCFLKMMSPPFVCTTISPGACTRHAATKETFLLFDSK
jgi:hypothetical protein